MDSIPFRRSPGNLGHELMTFKISPSIGIARIGNHPGSSPQDYYIGPEIPGTVIVPPNGYKDSSGRVLRQAARFRIYGRENGVFMGEIDSSVADITWTVELANTKAAFYRFTGIGVPPLLLRNPSYTGFRGDLIITPGPRTVSGPNGAAFFDTGLFMGTPRASIGRRLGSDGGVRELDGREFPVVPFGCAISSMAASRGGRDQFLGSSEEIVGGFRLGQLAK